MTIIYQTYSMGEAHLSASIVNNKSLADIWVYLVPNQGLAMKEACWYITDKKLQAKYRIFFGSRGVAEILVYFVKNPLEAGWQHKNKTMHFL